MSEAYLDETADYHEGEEYEGEEYNEGNPL
jgi:hypothetical protein